MFFTWLKRYMPRSLYGRAALILILPVVILQVVVAIAFIQRHFEGVTAQMSRVVALEVSFLIDQADAAPDAATAAMRVQAYGQALEFDTQVGAVAGQVPDLRPWFDLTGLTVRRVLFEMLPEARAIDLGSNDKRVAILADTRHGPLIAQFDRVRVSASNPHQLFVWMLFIGIVMTVIAFIFLRNQLRPIKRMAEAATAFGRGQIVPYRPSGAIEMRLAGNAFLDMRARLDRQAQQRRLMLSGISHDLRTPLTRMRLGLSLIEEDTTDLERDIQDMQGMLDEFLNYARDSSSEEAEDTDLGALVAQCVQSAERAGHDVTLTAVPTTAPIHIKPLAIKRALDNLITNAAKYGGAITVSLDQMDRALRISVQDNGPGIPPDLRDDALKPFTRLEGGRNQNKGGGVGLGLSIANDIMRAHGGSLRLSQSEAMGGLQVDMIFSK